MRVRAVFGILAAFSSPSSLWRADPALQAGAGQASSNLFCISSIVLKSQARIQTLPSSLNLFAITPARTDMK